MTSLKDLLKQDLLRKVLLLIAAVTVVSGLIQLIAPGFVLGFIGGETSASGNHSFGIVGMFMVLFGGLLIHALLAEKPPPVAVLWCGLQKFGAAVAVTMGVMRDLFSWLAMGVGLFDLLSGVLILIFWFRLRKPS